VGCVLPVIPPVNNNNNDDNNNNNNKKKKKKKKKKKRLKLCAAEILQTKQSSGCRVANYRSSNTFKCCFTSTETVHLDFDTAPS